MKEQKDFKLFTEYKPTGDQLQAIDALVKGINEGTKAQQARVRPSRWRI